MSCPTIEIISFEHKNVLLISFPCRSLTIHLYISWKERFENGSIFCISIFFRLSKQKFILHHAYKYTHTYKCIPFHNDSYFHNWVAVAVVEAHYEKKRIRTVKHTVKSMESNQQRISLSLYCIICCTLHIYIYLSMTCNIFLVWVRMVWRAMSSTITLSSFSSPPLSLSLSSEFINWFTHPCDDFALYVLILIGHVFASFSIFFPLCPFIFWLWPVCVGLGRNILTPWFHFPFKCTYRRTFILNWALIPIIFIINNLKHKRAQRVLWWMGWLGIMKRKRGSKWKNNNTDIPFTHAFVLIDLLSRSTLVHSLTHSFIHTHICTIISVCKRNIHGAAKKREL